MIDSGRFKKIIGVLVFLFTYIVGLFVWGYIINYSSESSTHSVRITGKRLPIISVYSSGDTKYNYLNGYRNEMDIKYVHAKMCILSSRSSKLSLCIEGYHDNRMKVDYEITDYMKENVYVRSEIEDIYEDRDVLVADIPVNNIASSANEMMLHIVLHQDKENPVHYYLRLQQGYGRISDGYIEYVQNFVNGCVNKDRKIAQFIEPSGAVDNSNFADTDIRASFEHITYGDLAPKLYKAPYVSLYELNDDVAMLTCTYRLVIDNPDGNSGLIDVREKYRVRQGQGRVVLLNFERYMDEELNINIDTFGKNYLLLGITPNKLKYYSSPKGDKVIFKKNGKLWSYNNISGAITKIALWKDADIIYDDYDIEILNVDMDGNADFIIYGQIPSGEHEGMNGVLLYHYDAGLNNVIERLTINSDRSYPYIQRDIKRLAYLSTNNRFYIALSGQVHAIELTKNNTATALPGSIRELSYKSSGTQRYIAYGNIDEKSEFDGSFKSIIIKDLSNEEEHRINADADEIISPLGFIKDDLIYGISKENDYGIDKYGRPILPFYKLMIVDAKGVKQKEYSANNCFIKGIEINDEAIEISRLKLRGGKYIEYKEDRVIYSGAVQGESVSLSYEINADSVKKKQAIIYFPFRIIDNDHRLVAPVLAADNNRGLIEVIGANTGNEGYYVFRYDEIYKHFDLLVDAIDCASNEAGCVVGVYDGTIWQRAHYSEQYIIDYDSLDDRFHSIKSVFKSMSNQDNVLDLNGCSMDNVLYFIKHDMPVIARADSKYMLIVGYDNYNLILRDYNKSGLGKEYYLGKNDSRELFLKNENRFICLR